MTIETKVDESENEFDAAWGDDASPAAVEDEFTTQTNDDASGDAPADDPDADKRLDSDDKSGGEVARLKAELERERQRVRSAEGRLSKFSGDVEEMRRRTADLEAKLAEKDKPAEKAEAPETDGYDNPNADLDPEFNAELTRRAKLAEQRAIEAADKKIAERTKAQEERLAALEGERQAERERRAHAEFESALRAQVPDYDELTGDEGMAELESFIAAQSPVLRRAYQQTADSGTVEEVADMLGHFRTFKSEKTQQRNVERKADAAVAVPSRGRSAIPKDKNAKSSKDDFDSGWELQG